MLNNLILLLIMLCIACISQFTILTFKNQEIPKLRKKALKRRINEIYIKIKYQYVKYAKNNQNKISCLIYK